MPHYECSSSNRDRFPFFHFWSSSVLSPNLKMWPALFQGQGVLSVRLFWLSFRGRGFFPRKTTQDQESEGLWHECHKISGLGILKFPSLPKRGKMINLLLHEFYNRTSFWSWVEWLPEPLAPWSRWVGSRYLSLAVNIYIPMGWIILFMFKQLFILIGVSIQGTPPIGWCSLCS